MASSELKGFKVTDSKRTRVCGIACKSLHELIAKCRIKFDFGRRENVTLHLQDGTIVDTESYFSTLRPQTMLILARNNETVQTGADIIYNALASINVDVLRAGGLAEQFMSQNLKEKVRVLARLVAAQEEEDTLEEAQKKTWKEEDMVGEEDLALKSTRSEDPDWFKGLDTRCTTKEAFMCRRCEDRIRGYLYKTCSDVRNSPVYRREDGHRLREVLEAAIADLKRALAGERYMGHYFDRNCTYGKMALCDRRGKFSCAGAWDAGRCNHRNGKGHTINPYRSREQRIVFSTWNLDHRIERARSIVPALLGAAVRVASRPPDLCPKGDSVDGNSPSPVRTVLRVNTDYFFRLLFTHHNLGLVHIVCHEKSARPSASCDPDQTVLVALTTVDGQKKGGGGGWAQTTERAVSA